MNNINELIDICEHNNEGFMPVVDFESWRVARTNHSGNTDKDSISSMGKHLCTDEAFVLLEGKAVLVVASGEDKPENIHCINMEKVKVYNVRKNVLHSLVMTKDAKILIVENRNTASDNSRVIKLDSSQIKYIGNEAEKHFSCVCDK